MLNRQSAPQFTEIKKFHLPTPEVSQLKNGVPLIEFDKVNQEVIKIELIFKAGKWFETKKGTGYFTAHLLDKGAAKKSSLQIAETFDLFGASVEINPGHDFTSLSLYSLSKNIENILPLFCELVLFPSFPFSELALLKDIFKQNLKVNNEKSSYLAGKIIRQNIFGENHPYGHSVNESEVDEITREDLVDFFKRRFKLHEVYVTGLLDDSAKKLLTANLSEISVNYESEPNPDFGAAPQTTSQHLDKLDSVQSSLRLGKKIINRTSSDYPALILLNHILGGYFGSRLMKNIREEKGLTYGIHSSINTLKNVAFFLIGTDVNKENRELALAEIKSEVRKLRQNTIETGELETAKNHLLGSLQLETANPFSVVEKLKVIRLNQLNEDFFSNLFDGIRMTNSEAIKNIAQFHLHEDDLFELSVG
jgi:predicted Zn-dependent peptidase